MSWRASKAPLCEVDTDMCRSPHFERINRLMNRLFRPHWCNQDDPDVLSLDSFLAQRSSLLLCPNWPFWTLSWWSFTGRIRLDVSDTILLSGVLWCSVGSVAQTKKTKTKKNNSFRWRYEFQPLFKCPAVTWWCLVFGKECHHQPGCLWDSFGRWTFWRVVDV